jgi:dienelactone hydrolase
VARCSFSPVGGTPWEPDAPIANFWDHSPLEDVAQVKTPTLFFVGGNDDRVPKAQSIEMYRALKSNGVPTHLYIAPRDGHQWQELRHQLSRGMLSWNGSSAMRGAAFYSWEKAPESCGRAGLPVVLDPDVKNFTK